MDTSGNFQEDRRGPYPCLPPPRGAGAQHHMRRASCSIPPRMPAIIRAPVIAVFTLWLAACTGHTATRVATASAATRGSSPAAHPADQDTDLQTIQAMKRGIDDLLNTDLSNIDAVNRRLSADPQQVSSSNPNFVVWRSSSGTLGGVPARSIELRSDKEDPTQALISVELAEPSVQAATFVHTFWPDAEFAPAPPDAAGSAAAWTARQGEAKVTMGQLPNRDVVSTVAIDRIR